MARRVERDRKSQILSDVAAGDRVCVRVSEGCKGLGVRSEGCKG